MKKKILFILLAVIAVAIIGAFFYFYLQSNSNQSFQAESVIVKVSIKSAGSFNTKLGIINLLNDEENNFKINVMGLEDFMSIDSNEMSLSPEERKDINLVFSNSKKMPSGIYLGKIQISDSYTKKEIPVILEIESDEVLFDSSLNLYPSDKKYPGDKLTAEVKISDLNRIGKSSVKVSYFIKDFDSNVIYSDTENLVVNNQVLVTKSITLPADIPKEDYVLGVVLEYKDSTGTSSAFFKIEGREINIISVLLIIAAAVLFVLLIVLWVQERRNMKDILSIQAKEINEIQRKIGKRKNQEKIFFKKPAKLHAKISEKPAKIPDKETIEIERKFEQQLEALKKAREGGYISQESYIKGKKRIEEARKQL